MIVNVLTTSTLRIKHDDTLSLLLVNWVGRQNQVSIMEGCWHIHQAMLQYQTFRILNDNRHLIGEWDAAAAWAGTTWLYCMVRDGLVQFAWVQSALDQPQVSTRICLAASDVELHTVKLFTDYEKAIKWLAEPSPIHA